MEHSFSFAGFRRFLLLSSFFLLSIFPFTAAAEHPLPDSLQQKLNNSRAPKDRISAHLAISDYYLRFSLKDALEHGQKALFLADQEGDHRLIMKAYKSIASAFYYMAIPDQALFYMDRTVKEAEKIGDVFEALNNQLNISLLYVTLGDFKKASGILEDGKLKLTKAYADAGKPFPMSDQITLFLNLGYCYSATSDFKKAIPKLDSGIALARKQKDQEILLTRLLISKADALLSFGKLEDCKRHLDESEELLRIKNDISLLATQQLVYGKVYLKEKKWDAALQFFKNALKEGSAIGNRAVIGGSIEGLYEVYQQVGNRDSTLAYLSRKQSFDKESTKEKAGQELLRKELLAEFKNREQELIKNNREARKQLWIITISVIIVLLVTIYILIRLRSRFSASNLKKLQLQLETERLRLQQEELQAKLSQQEKQISEYAYKLSKNALLQELVQDLQATKQPPDQVHSKDASEETEIGSPAVWEQFENRFLQTHTGFYERLIKTCPGLTPNERRLCAFLLLDMSTKEISVITGQSIRAIEIARIRLRKKLNLTQSNTSLFEFLSAI